ncbi:MAG TPA: ISNCY family transposase, partial [Candidatus Deferrimicrobiaceae bacterium]|nr:ISNCY family transposase [Candidatus Deferrimicrobiaceae bacterium]
MSRKEAPRAGLVKAALAGRITNAQGAQALGVSLRQFRRLKARYREAGVRGLVHRLRGRPSPRAVDVELRDRVLELVHTTYRDLNDCHATEKLREVEGLSVSRSTVRRLRRVLGLAPKRRRRPPQHRTRRPRRAASGALVLIDGSAFDWLGTGTPLLLLGAIDDATGTVLALHFRPAEDLHGYLTLLRRLAERDGLPVSLYGDRLGVFVRNDEHWSLEEELQGAQHPTHFGQVLRELGVGYIAAHSPQAKGRIERLWETLQDRLVAELRLRALHTVEAAEAYLPTYLVDHNRRFARPPAAADAVWRRPPRDLADRLSCRYTRRVARDNTVRLGPRVVQIPRGP